MKAIERLEALLDEKDAEIERLGGLLREAEEKAEADHTWTKHRDYKDGTEPSPDLPIPRLEIRWLECDHPRDGYTVEARFSLFYRHLLGHVVEVPLGLTRSSGDLASRTRWGVIDTPFRDGAHFRHEMIQLKLPGYVICGDAVHAVKICPKCGRMDNCHRGRDWRECDGADPIDGFPRATGSAETRGEGE